MRVRSLVRGDLCLPADAIKLDIVNLGWPPAALGVSCKASLDSLLSRTTKEGAPYGIAREQLKPNRELLRLSVTSENLDPEI